MVLLLVALVVLMAVGGRWLWVEMTKTPEEHALAGFFGEPDRQAVVGRRAAAIVDMAESILRVEHFTAALRDRAWKGTPCSLRRLSAHWWVWSFADGREFLVRQLGRTPRHLPRLIVAEVKPTVEGVAVAAYGPVSGPHLMLTVLDVQDAAA